METFDPLLYRRRTLTNSAAEFVEGRGGLEIINQVLASGDIEEFHDNAEFITEIDRFASKGVKFDVARFYTQSESSMEAFRDVTLRRLVATLKERRIEEQLGISLKDPSEFNFEYVLSIVNKLKDARDAPNSNSCKNFIRRCFRKVEDNRGVIGGILEMLPGDIYGSVLSGGFSLILTAIEHHAEQREALQGFLAAIPEKLESIQRFADIHHASARLHVCADAVMTAVFSVLESIVDKITRTLKVRLAESTTKFSRKLSKLSRRSGDQADIASVIDAQASNDAIKDQQKQPILAVDDALSALQMQIDRFQKEVDLCGHERLGEIKNDTTDIKRGQVGLVHMLQQNNRCSHLTVHAYQTVLGTLIQAIASSGRDFTEKTVQMLSVEIRDAFYRVCASDPSFDNKGGGANLLEFKRKQYEQEAEIRRSYGETNERIAAAWLKGLKAFPYDSKLDLTYLFEHLEMLSSDEKNVSNSIIRSQQIGKWLEADESRILNVEPATPAESLINPVSFASALLVTTLRLPARYAILAFFCMHRNNDDHSEENSGSIALIKSLNAQLLAFVAEFRPQVDLSKIQDLEYFRKARKSLKESLKLFGTLIELLPEDDKVFIVIDSLSRLSGSATNEDKVINRLGRIVKKEHGPIVKILVTATLGSSRVRKIADESLFVQDSASGFGALNVDIMRGEIRKSVEPQPITDQNASEESSDTDSD
ncbi:hypothetical protein PFICI_10840 [Pestalotiopsis fici W106-1]|uniref:Nephrocystin 3-like N-terminal domain-containing protein n=2 Tax=Pestalotiopsis fici TaxID=393283 RepID=W3WVT5_PESFW|nr:uncharacterized protein PFICI_10840 [Pestalotiopsis fici W106-1]AGO59049.1 hypothetical protein [Pestalotiopsis fici]ETS76966.1 hypothetical protein PFICI_10840 [Pestalotiopsis fici W106-1]